MPRILLATAVLALSTAPVFARTLLSAASPEPRLFQIDSETRSVLAESVVTLPGKIVRSVLALASHPDTGTLFAVVEEARCPGDPSRTTPGGCGQFQNDEAGCATAFQISDGGPVSCVSRPNGSCIPCLKANEALAGCTNVCLGTPTCADVGRTFAGNGGCALFSGDPGTCVQRFAQSACGPVPCFVRDNGTTCDECSAADIEAGNCTPSCGALRSRDPMHLATVDPASGVATPIGDLGEAMSGIAFTCDGRLFGTTGEARCQSVASQLVSIDPATAALTSRVQFDPNDDVDSSLTFDATAGRLLRGSGESDTAKLLSIDPDDFAVTARPLSGPAISERAAGAAWDEQSGDVFWSQTDSQGPLFRIPADGMSVALGVVSRPLGPIAFAGPVAACDVCGDGVVTGFEACDDGNAAGGDCCSATCTAESPGATCTSDDDACTLDTCAVGAMCTHASIGGADGVRCNFQRLGDPAVCGLSGLPRKVGKKLAPHARRGDRLVQAAAAKPARKTKRLAAARRELDAIAGVLVKRRPTLSDACAAVLEDTLQRIRDGLAGL